jgi:DNA-binding response OmpR family regulator
MRARGAERPGLRLTARAETDERVRGLDAGADDYLVKPFDMDELEARLRALARRAASAPVSELELGALTYFPRNGRPGWRAKRLICRAANWRFSMRCCARAAGSPRRPS